MVVVLSRNEYRMSPLEEGKTLLILGRTYYTITHNKNGPDILTRVAPQPCTRKDCQTKGNYWLFNVVNSPTFTHGIHLSLALGEGVWDAYIITPKLPKKIGETASLQPTDERIAYPAARQVIEMTA